jgi:hypothetical protein
MFTIGTRVREKEQHDFRCTVANALTHVSHKMLKVAEARLSLDPDSMLAQAQQEVPRPEVVNTGKRSFRKDSERLRGQGADPPDQGLVTAISDGLA